MDKIKAFYKIGWRKVIPLMVTEQEAQAIKELNRDFDRQYKADITYHKRTISMDKLMLDESIDFDKFNQAGASIEEEYIENEKNIEMTLRIEKALSKLTERQRYVVIQVFWEQKSLREIARELGVHHSTIAETYAAAIKKLKKFL